MQRAQRLSAFSRCVGQVLGVPGRRPNRIPRGRGKGRKRTDPASDPSAVREGSLLVMRRRLIRGRFPRAPPLVRMELCLLTRRSSSRCSSRCASCTDWRTKPHASAPDSTHTCKRVCAGTTALRRLFRQHSVTLPIRLSTRFRVPACRPCSQDRFTEPSSASLLADAAPVLLAETTVVESEWNGLGETRTSTARGVPRAARLAAKDFLQQTRFSGTPPWVLVGGGNTPAAHPATGPTSTRAVVCASSCREGRLTCT